MCWALRVKVLILGWSTTLSQRQGMANAAPHTNGAVILAEKQRSPGAKAACASRNDLKIICTDAASVPRRKTKTPTQRASTCVL